MPVIEFSLDLTTGELEMHIQGIAGPTCDDVAKLVEELVGKPTREQKTSEYHLRPRVQLQTRTRGKP